MTSSEFALVRNGPLEEFATVHAEIRTSAGLFEQLKSFDDPRWAFRGQGRDWPLRAGIGRHAVKPGIAEDYVMREFRRRGHHYLLDLPPREDDLEWLALMQHHGVPTRLLDWTRSPQVAAFFAAQSCNSGAPLIRQATEKTPPFVIWAVDTKAINEQAISMLGLPGNADLSSCDTFRTLYWSQPSDDLLLAVAVQPYRMNERLAIQQGLFLCSNDVRFPFHNNLSGLLFYAKNHGKQSKIWLHKLLVAAETRGDVLRSLDKININAATLFPGLDGFCQSLQVKVQVQELDGWPGVPSNDREDWVKGK